MTPTNSHKSTDALHSGSQIDPAAGESESQSAESESQSAQTKSNRPSERGASLVEYGLLIALIALVLFTAVGQLGGAVDNRLSNAHDTIAASAATP